MPDSLSCLSPMLALTGIAVMCCFQETELTAKIMLGCHARIARLSEGWHGFVLGISLYAEWETIDRTPIQSNAKTGRAC
ncbi:MAG: hypothetical protein ACXWTN_07680 [Methylosarcina sp.]